VRSVNGQPDLELRAMQGPLGRNTAGPSGSAPAGGTGQPGAGVGQSSGHPQRPALPLRVVGIDALLVAPLAPA